MNVLYLIAVPIIVWYLYSVIEAMFGPAALGRMARSLMGTRKARRPVEDADIRNEKSQ